MVGGDDRNEGDQDRVMAFSCALNCLLYEQDSGPETVNVGSELEPKTVDRQEAWRDYYARYLLVQLDARPRRLIVAADHCRLRLSAGEDPEAFGCAVDLCERAVGIIEEAGAVDDEEARQRLLAGTDHQLTLDTLGPVPGFVRHSTEEFLDRLRRIGD